MMFQKADIFGSRHGARVFLDEAHLLNMRDTRPDTALVHTIQDAYSLQSIPTIYYDAKFGIPCGINDEDFVQRWPTRKFFPATEFQLYARGIRLSEVQRKGFDAGDWIAVIPDHGGPKRSGPRGHGAIGNMLNTALFSQSVRAKHVIQAAYFRSQRDRDPHTRLDKEFLDGLSNPALAEVEGALALVTDDYKAPELRDRERNVGIEHIQTGGREAVRSRFGLLPSEILSHSMLEMLCFEQMYEPFSYDAVAGRELSIVRALKVAHFRAITAQRISDDAARYQVAKNEPISSGTAARLAVGEDYDLNLWGCFIVALYGGINPSVLYTSFEEYTDLFDIAAWFGYFARGEVDMLPPEIGKWLVDILAPEVEDPSFDEKNADLTKIRDQIIYLAKTLVGQEVLRAVATESVSSKTAVVVAPLFYHIVTIPHTGAANVRVDPRFKVGASPNEISLSYEGALPVLEQGQELSIHRFRPLLW